MTSGPAGYRAAGDPTSTPGPADEAEDPGPPAREHGAGLTGRIVGPFVPLLGRILGRGPIVAARRVLDGYGDAGGDLLAAGLAFGAVFALIPATLLVVGVTGFVVADPGVRGSVARQVAATVPPLEPFLTPALDELAAGSLGISVVGLAGFTWAASQFYGQLDGAFGLILRSPRRRNAVERTIRGLVAVALTLALFVILLGASVLATTSTLPVVGVVELVLRPFAPVIGYVLVAAVVAFVYRIVPTRSMSWRAVWLPAAFVALPEMLLATLFVAIAPFLASPAIFGPFVTVFATLAWLSWTFRLLLLGGAWVRERST